ncbi:MAG: hypothetical protein B7Y80_19040 [Hyphomicrobium sp. 32-62-53]|nr:MAG: hypothetical protein B7Z29_19395 [Hyphomicrobium sp. 12-62-95]OYX97601.1 MAG: hypothetical protein B7Y80_19040 [Hyphomicrobium sp. 32-62-53]
MEIAVRRGESNQNLKIKLGETAGGPSAASDTKESSSEPETLRLGPNPANRSSAEGAVIRSVDPDSDAAAKGLKPAMSSFRSTGHPRSRQMQQSRA